MVDVDPPIWSPRGQFRRLRRIFRRPADFCLALQIGYFLWSAPQRMEKFGLPILLKELSSQPRPTAPSVLASVERIARLRGFWLRRGFFSSRDTCYLRALTLYRFIDDRNRCIRIHYGIEHGCDKDRRRGHAWVTVDGMPWEAPDATLNGCVRELYVFPPEKILNEQQKGVATLQPDDVSSIT